MALHRNKPGTTQVIGQVRSLTKDDLAILSKPRTGAGSVKSFRESHHKLARLYAMGLRHEQVMAETGYGYSRVTTIYRDPAFKELIAQYTKMVNEAFANGVDAYYTLATNNMLAAERHIADKIAELDEEGELLPIKTALAISRDAADRFGYGKKKETTLNVNVDFAARLEQAMKRSGKTIDVSPNARGGIPPAPSQGPQLTPLSPAVAQPLRRRA